MNARFYFTVPLMLCVCLSSLYAEEEIENLLINPSIEGVEEEDIVWRGGDPNREDKLTWHVRGTDTGISEAFLDDEDFVDGEQSLYARRLKDGWIGIEQGYWTGAKEIILESDTTYTLAAWMRTSEPGNVIISLKQWQEPWVKCVEETVRVKTHWDEYHVTCTSEDLIERAWCEFKFETVNDLWFDFAHLYEGEYMPTEGPGAVTFLEKFTVTWASIKAQK